MFNFLANWLILPFCATSRPAAGSLFQWCDVAWAGRAAFNALTPGFPRDDPSELLPKTIPPSPTDVPVPEPIDVPVPDPGKSPEPVKPRPGEKNPKPRSVP